MTIYESALDYIFADDTMLEHGWKDHPLRVRKQAQRELAEIRKIDIPGTLKYSTPEEAPNTLPPGTIIPAPPAPPPPPVIVIQPSPFKNDPRFQEEPLPEFMMG